MRGLSLLPMSAGLLAAAFSAPHLIDRWGPRGALSAAAILTALAAVAIATGSAAVNLGIAADRLVRDRDGPGRAYATAPRLALAALPSERAGAGAGVINACTFLGGSIGVAGGAIAYGAAGLPAVTGTHRRPLTRRIRRVSQNAATGLRSVSLLNSLLLPQPVRIADNNPFGLKVYAFLKLCGRPFRHEHILDASKAPRAQLPYLTDGDVTVGDSDTIVEYLISRYALAIDDALTQQQRDVALLVRRTLDDLYWVMSYSRWKDDRFFPLFRDALLSAHEGISAAVLEQAREYDMQRYGSRGFDDYEPDAACRGRCGSAGSGTPDP